MKVRNFEAAINGASVRPKAVIVTPDLFRELDQEKKIERKLGTPGGVHAPWLGLEMPFYGGDIVVACDPGLEAERVDFKLPPAV